MDSYPCLTEVIATFHSLSISGATMGGYPNIVLIISYLMFFFNRNIAYSSSVSVFMASALNLIMKSAVFHFSCLKDLIFYLASAAFILSLNVILISFMKLSQFWVPSSLSSSLSFFCVYIPTTPPLRWAKIAVILLLVSMILLLLRYNCIPLYQSSNFVWSPSNHSESRTMLFGMTAYTFSFIVAGAGTINISVSDCLYLLEASSVICRDSSYSNNAFILFVLLELVLVFLHSLYYIYFIQ